MKNDYDDRLAAEMKQPLRLTYMSFAEDGFRGAAIVEAHGPLSACQRAWDLNINPGGEVLTGEVVNPNLPPEALNRLLSAEEVARYFGGCETVGEMIAKREAEKATDPNSETPDNDGDEEAPLQDGTITDLLPLYEHAKHTAEKLGHPHKLSRKEWENSRPPHTSGNVLVRFGTWRNFIDSAGIDAWSREYDRQYEIMWAIVSEFLDKLDSAKVFEHFECSKEGLESAISLHLTGCC